jgi:hypothetical protein
VDISSGIAMARQNETCLEGFESKMNRAVSNVSVVSYVVKSTRDATRAGAHHRAATALFLDDPQAHWCSPALVYGYADCASCCKTGGSTITGYEPVKTKFV